MKNTLRGLFIIALMWTVLPQANAAKFGLSPGGGEIGAGCNKAINIIVDTEGVNSLAADAFLKYNPNEITIVDASPGLGGTQIGLGNAYEAYPGNQVSNGIIRLTGFNKSGYFNGRAVMGVITIQPRKGVETASISFDFNPGSSTDSNIANEESKDVLGSASGASFKIVEGSCGKQEEPAPVKPAAPVEAVPAEQPTQTEKVSCEEELMECQNALIALENYYKKLGEDEFLIQGHPVLRSAAAERRQDQLILFLLIVLALSLFLNLDMLTRPENHIISRLPFYGKNKPAKHSFKKRKVGRKRKK